MVTRCGDYYQIPYRCLLPSGREQLLVAGRTVSSTFLAQGSLRVMATCMGMGQAAGTAAAMCIEQEVTPRALDVHALRSRLREQGAHMGYEEAMPVWNQGREALPVMARARLRQQGEA